MPQFNLAMKDWNDREAYLRLCEFAETDKPEGNNYCEVSAKLLKQFFEMVNPEIKKTIG